MSYPCFEIARAAGRINRLGQTARVQVIKFAFQDSLFETNILRLHRKIAAGQASMSDALIPAASVKILVKGI